MNKDIIIIAGNHPSALQVLCSSICVAQIRQHLNVAPAIRWSNSKEIFTSINLNLLGFRSFQLRLGEL